MTDYVYEKLRSTGFEIKFLRVDPTKWTYSSIINKILDIEADGYEIEMLMLDYLGMIPTTGCNQTGPMGSALQDMFRRMRNFCES